MSNTSCVLAEVANEVLSGCVTRKEVYGGQYKVVYEVDYLFLEEYDGHRRHFYDDIEDLDLNHKDVEACPQEHSCNNTSWVHV